MLAPRRFAFALALSLASGAVALAQDNTAPAQPKLRDADLANRPFIHAGTFAGAGSGGWARDDVELEGLFSLEGIEGKRLYDLLRRSPGANGQPVRGNLFDDDNNFRALRRNPLMEAFSIGSPVDEIPWDEERHEAREGSPHVWTTIEPDRFEIDERRNRRVLSVGTDIMDDTYFDTPEYTLLENRMTLRGRRRWDDESTIRRILVGAKIDGGLDDFGLKRAAKMDVRNDGSSPEETAGLDDAIRGGLAEWNGSKQPLAPVRRVHERLSARGVLPSTETHKDVLLLEPKAVLRSVRSRYHLNEAPIESVRKLHELGRERLTATVATAAAARGFGDVPPDRVESVTAFEKKVGAVLDGTLVAERAAERLRAIDPTFTATKESIAALLPAAPPVAPPRDLEDLAARAPENETRRVVAETVSELYHELADDLDDGSRNSLRRLITRSTDRALEPHAEWFVEWKKSKDPARLGPITTMDRFVELHREAVALDDGKRAAELAEYNEWLRAQREAGRRGFRDARAIDDAAFKAVGAQLENEKLRIWGRQIEAAGTAARGLWFDQARAFWVPESRRAYGNFLIDTMDFTAMYTADAWGDTPAAERNLKKGLPEDKLLGAKLVNELQIELGAEKEYVERLADLSHATERARRFMAWATGTAHPALAGGSDEAAYRAAWEKLSALRDDELKAELARLDEHARAAGGTLEPLTPEAFRRLPPALLRPEIRDGGSDARVETALAGAKFVFEQYRDFQVYASRLKGERVMRVLREAGATEPMEWNVPATSKGEAALRLVRETEATPAAGSGVVEALRDGTGNGR